MGEEYIKSTPRKVAQGGVVQRPRQRPYTAQIAGSSPVSPIRKRLVNPKPRLSDGLLMGFSAGVYDGEGSERVRFRPGRRADIVIFVGACDKKMIQLTAEAWGTSIQSSPSRRFRCSERDFPENTEGQEYTTQAYGTRAEMIVNRYRQLGVLSGERERKLRLLEEKMGRRILRG